MSASEQTRQDLLAGWHNSVAFVRRCRMELEGVVHHGVIVPDDATALPEGTRVQISPVPQEKPKSFGERFAQFKGAALGLPADLARQHVHANGFQENRGS